MSPTSEGGEEEDFSGLSSNSDPDSEGGFGFDFDGISPLNPGYSGVGDNSEVDLTGVNSLTATNTGANAGIPAPIVDPMYYQDQFIDPLLKDNVLQRENAQLSAEGFDAAEVGSALGETGITAGDFTGEQLNAQDQMGRSAQQAQMQLLKDAAGGQMSPVIQQQRDRATQDALALMATQRGVPAAAAMRTGMQGISEAGRQATEAASQQQMQATQMLGDAGTQFRQQEIAKASEQAQLNQQATIRKAELDLEAMGTTAQIEQERLNLVGNFQQQANLTNAQMSDEMALAETQVNAQLEQQRDQMITSMTSLGVERDMALLQVNAELGRLKEELLYKYWAGKLGAATQIGTGLIEATNESEDVFEQMIEEGTVFNLFGGYQTPEGYEVGGAQITGPLGYQGDLGPGTGSVPLENQPGADYSGSSTGAGGAGGAGGGSSGNWYKDPVTGQWVTSGIEAKQNVAPIGTRDEFYRTREANRFGQMENSPAEFAGNISATDPMAMNKVGTTKLGDVRKGLLDRVESTKQNLVDASRDPYQVTAKPSEQFASGAKDVSDYINYGSLGITASGMMSKDEEVRKKAAFDVGRYGAQKALEKGVEEASRYFDETTAQVGEEVLKVDDAARETAALAGKASGEVLEPAGEQAAAEAAPITAAQAAPYVGGALQFASSALQGGQVGPSAIRAAGSTLGGLAGAGVASALGQAAATGAAAGAMGGATSGAAAGSALPGIGTAIGGLVGSAAGAIGAAAGGAAANPLAEKATKRARAPLTFQGIQDPESTVGAPSAPGVYSGLETKRYIEDLAPVTSDMGSYVSDENAKKGVGPSKDELSDFLRELNPVKYDYKPEYGGEKDQYGIIAQDAQKTPVGDSFVKQNDDGTHVIDTGKATMVNMAALANQQKILDKQDMLIAELLKGRG